MCYVTELLLNDWTDCDEIVCSTGSLTGLDPQSNVKSAVARVADTGSTVFLNTAIKFFLMILRVTMVIRIKFKKKKKTV